MAGNKLDLIDRLHGLSMPEPNTGCRLWLGALNDHGYGRVKLKGRFKRAHIAAYECEVGPVPEGLCLDHTCRTRICINPEHLDPVTPVENTRRGCLARGLKWSGDLCLTP